MITDWVKTQLILGLDNSERARVEELIPIVEGDYLRIRNKPWDIGNILTVTGGATAGGTVVVEVGGSPLDVPVLAGDNAVTVANKIYNSMQINFIKVQQNAAALTFPGYNELTYTPAGTGSTATISGIDSIYPQGAEHTAIRMIKHILFQGTEGAQSESLGDWSVTYAKGGKTYPDTILDSIKRYVSWA